LGRDGSKELADSLLGAKKICSKRNERRGEAGVRSEKRGGGKKKKKVAALGAKKDPGG